MFEIDRAGKEIGVEVAIGIAIAIIIRIVIVIMLSGFLGYLNPYFLLITSIQDIVSTRTL